jgi:hypothetical protein
VLPFARDPRSPAKLAPAKGVNWTSAMSTALSSLVSDGSGRVWGVKGSRSAGRKGVSEARLAAIHAARRRKLLPGVVENNWVLNKVRILIQFNFDG